MSSSEVGTTVLVEATQVRSQDDSFGWAILVHDVLVEYVVRDGEVVRFSVTRQDFYETELPGFMTLVRVDGLVETMGVRKTDVHTMSSTFRVPRSVYDRVAGVDDLAKSGGVNEVIAYLGKNMRELM